MMKGALLLLLAVSLNGPTVESLLASARKYDKATFVYQPPPAEKTDGLRVLVRALTVEALAGKSTPASKDRTSARKLGMELVRAQDGQGSVWVLRESGTRRSGDGFYAFRPRGVALCVQAPHTFFDEGTSDIAQALFEETHAVALFSNTVHRHAAVAPGEPSDSADVAHAEHSVFQSATEGLLAAGPIPVVQIHGFGPREKLPPDTAAVVSDGAATRPADAPVVLLRSILQAELGGSARVLLFGVDAQELGATTNVQGRSVRKAGVPFLHIEMSQKTRAAEPGPAQALARALREALKLSH
jgi:hypothetical protein